MSKKCPNCGSNYGEYDIFCARCGYRLNANSEENNEFEQLKKAALANAKEFYDERNRNAQASKKEVNFSQAKLTDTPLFNFALCILITACALIFVLYFTIGSHNAKKDELKYKNLISNPAQIPELKEPSNFKELSTTFYPVINFLELYLKYSKDSIEKKEQVFASYLNEVEKLPHLTNEALIDNDLDTCKMISNPKRAKYCVDRYDESFKNIGIKSYTDGRLIYFYPNYDFINKKYSKYLSKQMKEYLVLKAKYNEPANIDIKLIVKPKELAQRIAAFEKLYLFNTNIFVKESAEKIIYQDFRAFIFAPAIYNTTTQEMSADFKNAYNYYISSYKTSALRPVVMSYLDKKRGYSEENFNNDYPYKNFDYNIDETIKNATFKDVFSQLRKNAFSDGSQTKFSYVFDGINNKWQAYESDAALARGKYVVSEPDENNNILVYNHALSQIQELNISKFATLFLYKNNLYTFNSDKLAISKFFFNGRQFSIQDLSFSDITSLFPGVEIISIDSYSNYNIQIEKDNQKASYIILTRYSRGYDQYTLTVLKGNIGTLTLPNMFSVDSEDDVVISYHGKNINPEGTSESVPTYKFVIHTRGHQNQAEPQDSDFSQYDEQTALEGQSQKHEANMMPKIDKKQGESEAIPAPPEQKIEPPKDED